MPTAPHAIGINTINYSVMCQLAGRTSAADDANEMDCSLRLDGICFACCYHSPLTYFISELSDTSEINTGAEITCLCHLRRVVSVGGGAGACICCLVRVACPGCYLSSSSLISLLSPSAVILQCPCHTAQQVLWSCRPGNIGSVVEWSRRLWLARLSAVVSSDRPARWSMVRGPVCGPMVRGPVRGPMVHGHGPWPARGPRLVRPLVSSSSRQILI